MQMKSTHSFIFWHKSASIIYLILFIAAPSIAEESYSTSGRLDLRGVAAQNSDSGEGRTGLDRKDQDRHASVILAIPLLARRRMGRDRDASGAGQEAFQELR